MSCPEASLGTLSKQFGTMLIDGTNYSVVLCISFGCSSIGFLVFSSVSTSKKKTVLFSWLLSKVIGCRSKQTRGEVGGIKWTLNKGTQ